MMSDEILITPPPPKGKSKLIIIIAAVVGLLVIGLIVLFFTPLGKSLFSKHEAIEVTEPQMNLSTLEFVQLPEILVNLRSAEGRLGFLKATFIVEVDSGEVAKKIEKLKPVLVDLFQVYLRELDPNDLKGSAGLQRVRQELTTRTNNVITPEKVKNILFKEFLVQ